MDERSKKILIADDNRDIHEDIKYILDSSASAMLDYQETKLLKDELFGEESDFVKNDIIVDIKYRIEDAYQGQDAVKMVESARNSGDPYSVIFMDVRMPPGIDGIQAIEQIWRIDPDVEIVICTAYSDYSWDQIISKLGQNDNLLFIRKPFDSVSLKQITLAMATKWNLKRQIAEHIENLEQQVEKRTQELTVLVEKLTAEILLREGKERLLAHSAYYDSLTDLLNRRSFYSSLPIITMGDSFDYDEFSIFFIDIDDFKEINDVMGHDVGDRLLIETAERIKEVLGENACAISDPAGRDVAAKAIYRLGGDEFTAIINAAEKEKTAKIAQDLINSVKRPFFISGFEINVSCCIGISTYPQDSISSEVLLKYADIALYEAKKANGVYRHYDNPGSISFINELQMENDLKKAVSKEQIDVYFQCLVNSKDEPIGVQALARWLHPEFGTLQPDQFIHIAEKSDQIISLGTCILRNSVKYLKTLHNAGYDKFFVLVNCTTKQFYNPDFINIIKNTLQEADMNPSFLKLGLEEKFSLQATSASLEVIKELNNIGVQFTLNGFESEYPAFVFLQQVPKDTIVKLSKDYVKNIVNDTRNRNFLLALMDIIKSWDLNIIISGIETKQQKEILGTKECILQGYHYNVPKPFEQFMEDLKSIKHVSDCKNTGI
jgi:diguanylate cyclase (GGDEF)-like protein